MKVLIDISEGIKTVIDMNGTNEVVAEMLWQAVKNGTPIPDNATNGEVLKTMFMPNQITRTGDAVHMEYDFTPEWWNAPYQKGGKE